MSLTLFLLFSILAGWVVVHGVVYYKTAVAATTWERMLATSRDSATWLWAKVLLVASFLLNAMSYAADFFNMPDVSAFIHDKVPVQYLGWALLAIATMTFLARLRSLV